MEALQMTRHSIKKTAAALAIFCLSIAALAQVPEPGKPQAKPVLLKGGTAHLGTGSVIANAVVAFDKGKITLVGDASKMPANTSSFEVIDVTGKHVYPGFIAPNSTLGLSEIGNVRATRDQAERGQINPNVRSLIAYNTDSELIPTLRFNGVLLAQVTPRSGLISGTSSIVGLDGWNWEDAVLKADDGIHLNWPSRFSGSFNFATFTFETKPNKEYGNQVDVLKTLFGEAKAYPKRPKGETPNLKLAALQGLFSGEKTLYIHTDAAKSIVESVTFAKENGVPRVVIIGASGALRAAGFLKDHKVPVILNNLHRLPGRAHGDIDEAFKLPAQLHKVGVQFALSYSSTMSSRNLGFIAGTAAAYGLDREQALKAITASSAEILGIGDRAGSLEVGKDATLFVSEGDALDMRTNQLALAFIQGSKVNLDGRQQILYKRFKKKYGL